MNEPRYHLPGTVRAKAESMEDFDGPLDLILLLLSKNKMEIQDISISAILDQYLAFLEEQKKMDMEIASEFITMASHLMLIKTKMLLSYAEQQEAISEMEQLIQSLTERQQQEAMSQIRTAIPFMEERNGIGAAHLTKEPEPMSKDRTYRYQHTPDDLLRSVALIAERRDRSLPPPVSNFVGIVGREPYPIKKKAFAMIRDLLIHGKMKLMNLFQNCRSKSELVASFLAVLELCRKRNIDIETEEDGTENISFVSMPDQEEEFS